MPIYEYECPRCHARIEEIRPVDKRKDKPTCKACYEAALSKVDIAPGKTFSVEPVLMELQVSAPAVDGWYNTVGLDLDPEGRKTR